VVAAKPRRMPSDALVKSANELKHLLSLIDSAN
jgi:hypothetical protein